MPLAAVPALVWGGVAAGAGSVAGAAIGAHAAGKASQVQQQAEQQSLALQRQMYEEARPRYQPYLDVGQSVLPTLRSLAGNVQAPRYGTNLRDLSIYGSPQMAQPGGQGQPPAATGGTVLMRAPNGLQKAVLRELVAHYQSLGGQVVG